MRQPMYTMTTKIGERTIKSDEFTPLDLIAELIHSLLQAGTKSGVSWEIKPVPEKTEGKQVNPPPVTVMRCEVIECGASANSGSCSPGSKHLFPLERSLIRVKDAEEYLTRDEGDMQAVVPDDTLVVVDIDASGHRVAACAWGASPGPRGVVTVWIPLIDIDWSVGWVVGDSGTDMADDDDDDDLDWEDD